MSMTAGENAVSFRLRRIVRRYPGTMSVTWSLLLAEAVLNVGFPLAIGIAVDGLLDGDPHSLWFLGGLCLAVLVAGAARRFFDTRAYARIYRDLSKDLVAREKRGGGDISRLSARIRLLDEVVDYFENDLPALLDGVIAFFGVLILLAFTDIGIMGGCVAASLAIIVIYKSSEGRIYSLNRQQNDEIEGQVDALHARNPRRFDLHIRRLMRWSIRLSDLETLNFSAAWAVLAILLLGSVWTAVGNEALSYGAKITAIMYVFQYIEAVLAFPLLYQQFIRLQEITRRLSPGDNISKSQ